MNLTSSDSEDDVSSDGVEETVDDEHDKSQREAHSVPIPDTGSHVVPRQAITGLLP